MVSDAFRRRIRRIGIVAVARRLLIALWRYLEDGVILRGGTDRAALMEGNSIPAGACRVKIDDSVS